jgi:hypothetical protein
MTEYIESFEVFPTKQGFQAVVVSDLGNRVKLNDGHWDKQQALQEGASLVGLPVECATTKYLNERRLARRLEREGKKIYGICRFWPHHQNTWID